MAALILPPRNLTAKPQFARPGPAIAAGRMWGVCLDENWLTSWAGIESESLTFSSDGFPPSDYFTSVYGRARGQMASASSYLALRYIGGTNSTAYNLAASEPFTAFGRIYPMGSNHATFLAIAGKNPYGGNWGAFFKKNDYKFRIYRTTSNAESPHASSGLNAWHLFAMSHDGATARFYHSGLYGEVASAMTSQTTNTNSIGMGNHASYLFAGAIDFFGFVYGVAWEAEQMARFYRDPHAFLWQKRRQTIILPAATAGADVTLTVEPTEGADTSALQLTVGQLLTIEPVEGADTSALAANVVNTVALQPVEGADTSALQVGLVHTANFQPLEQDDTSTLQVLQVNTATVEPVEGADFSTLQLELLYALTVEPVEGADSSTLQADIEYLLTVAPTEAGDTSTITLDVVGAGVSLTLEPFEQDDTSTLQVGLTHTANFQPSELADTSALTIALVHTANVLVSEMADTSALQLLQVNSVSFQPVEADDAPTLQGLVINTANVQPVEADDLSQLQLSVSLNVTLTVEPIENDDAMSLYAVVEGANGSGWPEYLRRRRRS